MRACNHGGIFPPVLKYFLNVRVDIDFRETGDSLNPSSIDLDIRTGQSTRKLMDN